MALAPAIALALLLLLSISALPASARRLRALITNVCDQPLLYQQWEAMGNEYPEIVLETTPSIAKIAPADLKDAGYYDLIHWNWPLAELVEGSLLEEVRNSELGTIRWGDIIPSVAAQSAYGGKVYAFPVDTDPWLMYYRTDHVPTAPATWPALIAEARRLNGTDLNGDGEPDFGVCLTTAGHTAHLAFAMAAPRLMYDGSLRQGYLWDLNSDDSVPMAWVLHTAAWEGVLEDLRELYKYAPQGLQQNTDSFPLYHGGRCGFYLYFPSAGTYVSRASTFIRGKQGTAPLPGSSTVFDRALQKMVPCTKTLCPKARLVGGELVNVAGYVASPTKIVVNPRSDQLAKAKEFAVHLTNNYDPRAPSGINPYRRSHLNATWFTEAPQPWVFSDAAAYVAAIEATSREPIRAPYPQAPSSTIMRDVVVEMADELLGITGPRSARPLAGLLSDAEAKFETRALGAGYSMAATERALRAFLNLPPLIIKTSDDRPLPTWTIVVITVMGIVFVGAIAAGAVALVMMWERRRHIPRDPSAPFVAFFVTTKNEAAVRDHFGANADAVFDELRRVVTRTATTAQCHAARHLDAHHLLVATTLRKALICAAKIHAAVEGHTWEPTHDGVKGETAPGHDLHPGRPDRDGVSTGPSTPQPNAALQLQTESQRSGSQLVDVRRHPIYSQRVPAISIGMVFGKGTVESDDGGKTFVYGGPPVLTAAALADIACFQETVVETHGLDAAGAVDAFGPPVPVVNSLERAGVDAVTFRSSAGHDRQMLPCDVSDIDASVHDFYCASSLCSDAGPPPQGLQEVSPAEGNLVSALELASGKLTARHVTIFALNVPAMRAAPPPTAAARHRHADLCRAVVVAVTDAAQDARASCLGAADGVFVFGINAVVATARGPERAVAAGLAAIAALRDDLHVAAGCGVAAGTSHAGLMRYRAPEGHGSEASLAAAHSTVATTARSLAAAALRYPDLPGCMVDGRALADLHGFRHQHVDLAVVESDGCGPATTAAARSPSAGATPCSPPFAAVSARNTSALLGDGQAIDRPHGTPKGGSMRGSLSTPPPVASASAAVCRLKPLLITAVSNDACDAAGNDEWMYQLQQRADRGGRAARATTTLFKELHAMALLASFCQPSLLQQAQPPHQQPTAAGSPTQHDASVQEQLPTQPLPPPTSHDAHDAHDGAATTRPRSPEPFPLSPPVGPSSSLERLRKELSGLAGAAAEQDRWAAVAHDRLSAFVAAVEAERCRTPAQGEEDAVGVVAMKRSAELFLAFPDRTL